MMVLFVSLQGKTVTSVKGVRVCRHHCRDYGLGVGKNLNDFINSKILTF